ncbi:MAG TPA: hypothetical protein VF462_08870 [Micromonosporaceae bacterium]
MTQGIGAATLRRVAVTATAALAVAAGVMGCTDQQERSAASAPSSTAPPSPAMSAKETLLASVPDGSEGPFRFSGRDGSSTVSGNVDPAAKGLHLTTAHKDPEHGFTLTMAFLFIEDQLWVRIRFTGTEGLTGLPKLPDKWLKLDPSRLTDGESAPRYDGPDPGNAGPLIEAATSVEHQGGGRYRGVIDLTAANAGKALDDDERIAALGSAAKRVPFTAVVGSDRKLASLVLNVPAAGAAKAYQYVVNYRDYGGAPRLAVPQGSAAEPAPPIAYEILNG